jgi:hypothetical protein
MPQSRGEPFIVMMGISCPFVVNVSRSVMLISYYLMREIFYQKRIARAAPMGSPVLRHYSENGV